MTVRLDVLPATTRAGAVARALDAPDGPDCPASYLRRRRALRVLADGPVAAALRAGFPPAALSLAP